MEENYFKFIFYHCISCWRNFGSTFYQLSKMETTTISKTDEDLGIKTEENSKKRR